MCWQRKGELDILNSHFLSPRLTENEIAKEFCFLPEGQPASALLGIIS